MSVFAVAKNRLALLDRDGTIIVDKVYLKDPEGVEFAPGALEGMRLLHDCGFALALVTNQSGLARGYFDEATLARVHARLAEMLAAEGLALEAIYYCPHGPDEGCDCRKPQPGLALQALNDLGFTPDQAVFLGDSDADMGAAVAAGVPGLRVASATLAGLASNAENFLDAARRACALFASDATP